MSRRTYRPLPATPAIRATGVALGVHLFDGEYYLRRDFVRQITDLNQRLQLSSSWLGVPLKDAPDYAEETHEAMGILVEAPITGGRLRGWMKRVHRIGADVVLFCEKDGSNNWVLTSVEEGRFSHISNIGVFDLTKLPTLVSLLLLHAHKLPGTSDMAQYVKLMNDPMLCELYQPPTKGFFSGLHRHVLRLMAEREAKERESEAGFPDN